MIEVEVEDAAWTAALPDAGSLVRNAAEAALRPTGGDVVVLLTCDGAVQRLNATFRGKDVSTNVLSFAAPMSARPHLGDLALAFGVCEQEALVQGKRLDQHLSHLVAHGVLHLLGYDHEIDGEAEAMEARERALMATLGWPDPYASPSAAERHAGS